MKSIFVGNISFKSTEDDIRSLFAEYGDVSRVKIISDRETGRSRGFCFVDMDDDAAATTAISELNGRDYMERELRVNEAEKRD